MNRITWWCMRIATMGPIGYSVASGTVTSLLTLPLVYGLHALLVNQWIYLGVVVVLLLFGGVIISKALPAFNYHEDPSEIVFDEVVGCLLVFWGISLTPQSVLVGFLLFRALDIIKVGWIKKAEDLVGAWGVMGDDILAAMLTNIALRLLL